MIVTEYMRNGLIFKQTLTFFVEPPPNLRTFLLHS